MTRVSPMPPDLPTVIQALRDRVDSLERTQPQATTPQHQTGLTFTAPTDLPIRAPRDFRAESLWADAPAAVADDTVWELRRNGTAVGTVTITAGDTHGHTTLDPPVVGDVFDVFTVVRTDGSDPATVRVLGRSTSPDSPAVGGGSGSAVWAKLQGGVGTINSSPGSFTQSLAYVAGADNAYWEVNGDGDLKILTAGWYEIGGWGEFGDDFIAGDIAALQWGPSNMMVSVPAPGPSFGVSLATGPHYFAVDDVLSFTFTATWSSGSQRTIDQNGDSWVWIRRMEGEYAAPGGGGGPT